MYFRTIDRQMRNEFVEHTSWGDADTYDRTRQPIKAHSTLTEETHIAEHSEIEN